MKVQFKKVNEMESEMVIKFDHIRESELMKKIMRDAYLLRDLVNSNPPPEGTFTHNEVKRVADAIFIAIK